MMSPGKEPEADLLEPCGERTMGEIVEFQNFATKPMREGVTERKKIPLYSTPARRLNADRTGVSQMLTRRKRHMIAMKPAPCSPGTLMGLPVATFPIVSNGEGIFEFSDPSPFSTEFITYLR